MPNLSEVKKKDLGLSEESSENTDYFLKWLSNLVILVKLTVGDAASRMVKKVCAELQKTYEQRTEIHIITNHDFQVLLFKNLFTEH